MKTKRTNPKIIVKRFQNIYTSKREAWKRRKSYLKSNGILEMPLNEYKIERLLRSLEYNSKLTKYFDGKSTI